MVRPRGGPEARRAIMKRRVLAPLEQLVLLIGSTDGHGGLRTHGSNHESDESAGGALRPASLLFSPIKVYGQLPMARAT